MFLHHTMTDAEILRTCAGCESHHLRLVANRLRQRIDDLHEIGKLATHARDCLCLDINDLWVDLDKILQLTQNGG